MISGLIRLNEVRFDDVELNRIDQSESLDQVRLDDESDEVDQRKNILGLVNVN